MAYYSHRRKKKGRQTLRYTRNSTHEEERGKANTFVSLANADMLRERLRKEKGCQAKRTCTGRRRRRRRGSFCSVSSNLGSFTSMLSSDMSRVGKVAESRFERYRYSHMHTRRQTSSPCAGVVKDGRPLADGETNRSRRARSIRCHC